MLTSKARRRLAQKTSALGIASTLAVFVGSVLALSSPAEAAVDKNLSIAYTCMGGPFTNTSINVPITVPDTASGTFDVKWAIPPLTLAQSPAAATQVKVTGKLLVTGGTHTDLDKSGANVTMSATAVPAGQVTSTVAVTATTGGKVNIKAPTETGSLKLSLANAPSNVTSCTAATSTESVDITVGQGGGAGTDDIVKYNCTLATGTTDADYPAEVDIEVKMTPPTSAKANEDASIPWTGTIQSTGDPLKLPTSFPASSKLFATVKASGAGAPTSVTAEALLMGATAGQNLTTLPALTFKVKPTTTGTVSLTAGDLAFGTSSSAPAIKCTAPTTGLKTFTLTVSNGTSSPTPTPSNTNTSSTPKPTKTTTLIVTHTPSTKKTTKKSQTPKAGADTGGGGAAGPDGRTFMLVGSALVMAAGVGGLALRRRNLGRG
ncbi:hypothetical protein ABZ297_15375 [Nonomuraea sp. NPDC005983]|uniref:hypothetical protein n=1 Tax=Nonomuraea sp. NPDC005983 TaxID=3155595 RepID=UPI0033B2D1FE